VSEAILGAVGTRIRQIREEAGISQEAAAERAGLNRVYYNRVERGRQNVSLLTLAKIAIVLRTTVAHIVESLPEADLHVAKRD
jgi:transcriptional regulator with XRE-family HTH domain